MDGGVCPLTSACSDITVFVVSRVDFCRFRVDFVRRVWKFLRLASSSAFVLMILDVYEEAYYHNIQHKSTIVPNNQS